MNGCELWILNCDYVNKYIVVWRKIKRRICRLPYIYSHSPQSVHGVVDRERMRTAFPHKKLIGNDVLTRKILRDIFLSLLLKLFSVQASRPGCLNTLC